MSKVEKLMAMQRKIVLDLKGSILIKKRPRKNYVATFSVGDDESV